MYVMLIHVTIDLFICIVIFLSFQSTYKYLRTYYKLRPLLELIRETPPSVLMRLTSLLTSFCLNFIYL